MTYVDFYEREADLCVKSFKLRSEITPLTDGTIAHDLHQMVGPGRLLFASSSSPNPSLPEVSHSYNSWLAKPHHSSSTVDKVLQVVFPLKSCLSNPQTLKDSSCPPLSPRILQVISRLQDAQIIMMCDWGGDEGGQRAKPKGGWEITTVCHLNPTLLNTSVTKAPEFTVPAAAQG
ncbi:hypothetical protein C8R45DRAFT_1115707 [Mycena sanguinolenta]|nr:hypothetical protein C8R45DRAFT_1115707 [Mycena sanguinolenta]